VDGKRPPSIRSDFISVMDPPLFKILSSISLPVLPGWDTYKAAVFEDPYEKKLQEQKQCTALGAAPESPSSNPWSSVRLKSGEPLRENKDGTSLGAAAESPSNPWSSVRLKSGEPLRENKDGTSLGAAAESPSNPWSSVRLKSGEPLRENKDGTFQGAAVKSPSNPWDVIKLKSTGRDLTQ